jgi:hypothetical protein
LVRFALHGSTYTSLQSSAGALMLNMCDAARADIIEPY